MMLYSCTHMATVGINGLNLLVNIDTGALDEDGTNTRKTSQREGKVDCVVGEPRNELDKKP